MKHFMALILMAGLAMPSHGLAQDKSGVPDVSMFKMMLDANKTGWIAFREYNGQQLIYFTNMLTSRCRLKEIRFSINEETLDQTFNMPACIPDSPFMIPADGGVEDIALILEPGVAKTISVQAVFEDDTETDMITFRPCEGVGDGTCAKVVE